MTQTGREAEVLRMSNSIAGTMPGTLGLSFYFSVAKADLVLEYETDDHLYYVAPLGAGLAYSTGSLVITRKDEIGVRLSKIDGSAEWYVDNSDFNHLLPGTAVWSRPVEDADDINLTRAKVLLPLKGGNIRFITFDGYSGHLLHFTYEEIDNDLVISRQYVFRKEGRAPSIVNIEGAELVVFEASRDEIHYRALRSFN